MKQNTAIQVLICTVHTHTHTDRHVLICTVYTHTHRQTRSTHCIIHSNLADGHIPPKVQAPPGARGEVRPPAGGVAKESIHSLVGGVARVT